MKLSKTQKELLKSLKLGKKLHYMEYMGTFNPSAYFFVDCGVRCTAAANALIDKGLVEKVGSPFKPEFVISEAGKERAA